MTTPEVSAIRDADRIIGLLEHAGITEIGLGSQPDPGGYGTPGRHDVFRRCTGYFSRGYPWRYSG